MLPFFFLSALGGELADKFDKALVARRLKLAEIPVAALAAIGFVAHSPVILLLAILGYGCIAALFGPIKYGILPDHLKTEELSAGNALVEAATFAAILIGTVAGGEVANLASATGFLCLWCSHLRRSALLQPTGFHPQAVAELSCESIPIR